MHVLPFSFIYIRVIYICKLRARIGFMLSVRLGKLDLFTHNSTNLCSFTCPFSDFKSECFKEEISNLLLVKPKGDSRRFKVG